MNERTQIDWSQVIPGKTWLESPNGCQRRVDAVVGEDVWVYYRDGKNSPAHHLSWTKSSIESCKWRIREEWVDVTHECTLSLRLMGGGYREEILVGHGGRLNQYPGEYKLVGGPKLETTRVYKRRYY